MPVGKAYGRSPDGSSALRLLAESTPGTTNAGALPSDIVLNEIMYSPISGDNDDQFVELFNRGACVRLTWAGGSLLQESRSLFRRACPSRPRLPGRREERRPAPDPLSRTYAGRCVLGDFQGSLSGKANA